MKKIFLLIFLAASLSSCRSTYYQVCKVASDLPTSTNGAYAYTDPDCEVSYDFWSNGGSVDFVVTNNSDKILYVDLSKSFFVKNGVAYDYYLNRTISTASYSSSSKSSGVAGTALGYWNYFGKQVPGSVTAATANTESSQKSMSVAFEEKQIVAIPPFASKIFSEYMIMKGIFHDCDLEQYPSKKENASMYFDLSTTPVAFTNFICYRVGDDGQERYVENCFYVSEVSNKHEKAVIHKVKKGCPSEEFKKEEKVFIRTSPKEFYHVYDKKK